MIWWQDQKLQSRKQTPWHEPNLHVRYPTYTEKQINTHKHTLEPLGPHTTANMKISIRTKITWITSLLWLKSSRTTFLQKFQLSNDSMLSFKALVLLMDHVESSTDTALVDLCNNKSNCCFIFSMILILREFLRPFNSVFGLFIYLFFVCVSRGLS